MHHNAFISEKYSAGQMVDKIAYIGINGWHKYIQVKKNAELKFFKLPSDNQDIAMKKYVDLPHFTPIRDL